MNLRSYIHTKEWRLRRIETFLKKGKKCLKCGSEKQIHVHHATYERIGAENIETDLFPLCKRCHEFFHKNYEGHFIKNTLEFLSTKELPKYEPVKKIRPVSIKKKKKPKWKRVKILQKKQKKAMKKKKQKEPHMGKVYSKTQGKDYKYKSFKL